MGNAAHHRTSISAAERASLRAAFTTPTGTLTPSPRAVATFPAAAPLWADQAHTVSPQLARNSHTWGGRTIPKWCRWGYWSTDGWELTVTRII